MKVRQLKTVIEQGESENVEFKREVDLTSKYGKAKFLKEMLALVNSPASPSYLIIGVEDGTGQLRACRGIQEEQLQQTIADNCKPPLLFSFQITPLKGTPIGVIRIPHSTRKPHTLNRPLGYEEPNGKQGHISEKQVFIRRGSTIDEATVDEIIEMAQDVDERSEYYEHIIHQLGKMEYGLQDIVFVLDRLSGDGWWKDVGQNYIRKAAEVSLVGMTTGSIAGALATLGWLTKPFLGPVIGLLVALLSIGSGMVEFELFKSILAGASIGWLVVYVFTSHIASGLASLGTPAVSAELAAIGAIHGMLVSLFGLVAFGFLVVVFWFLQQI